MSERQTILLVEDEKDVLMVNARLFARRGYDVRTAQSCTEAYQKLKETPDLLILDIMLPDGSGYDICQAFRQNSDHPVIFLSGKGQIADKVQGLQQGGDYYLTKPYDTSELLAVVDMLLKRHLQAVQKRQQASVICKGSLVLEVDNSRALCDGRDAGLTARDAGLTARDAGLTAKEFSLLLMLVRNEEKVVSPQELYERVWGMEAADDVRTVRFHIANLRKKLDADNAPDFDIVSVYGKGYMFTTMR